MSNVDTRNSSRLWLALIPLLLGYFLDLATKQWVVNSMELGERREVIPGLVNWHFIRNPGAAFSIGTEYTWVFTTIQSVALIVVLYLILRRTTSPIWLLVLGALAGGIAGNLTDRLFREPGFGIGHVVDMISVRNFAIFNVADSLIVCSMVLVVLLTLFGVNLDGSRTTTTESSPDTAESTDEPKQ